MCNNLLGEVRIKKERYSEEKGELKAGIELRTKYTRENTD